MKKIMAAAVFLSACSGSPTEVTVVLDWTINTNHAGVYAALAEGYYEDEGLSVTIETPPETGALALVAAGRAQVAFSYQEEMTFAAAQSVPAIAVAAVLQHNTSGFAAPANKGLRRPMDLQNKTYGGWGSPVEEAVLKALVEADGGNFSTVRLENIGSMDFFTAVENLVDFAWIFEGWTGIEAKLKNMELTTIKLADYDAALDYYTPVLAVGSEWAESNPAILKAFLRATARGYKLAEENPSQVAAILLEAAPELDAELVGGSLEYLAPLWRAEAPVWGWMEETRWTAFRDWLFSRGLLEASPKPAAMFTNGYLEQ